MRLRGWILRYDEDALQVKPFGRAGDVDQGGFEGGEVHYVFNEDRWTRRIPDVISVRLAH